ncbi:uncharacterized protein [Excalfactoria chinensis]|uniref:uncharacterized protein n=1 Tax=Excalfactoria chinensis TaxID=46218 RepID=UPI003B3AAA20
MRKQERTAGLRTDAGRSGWKIAPHLYGTERGRTPSSLKAKVGAGGRMAAGCRRSSSPSSLRKARPDEAARSAFPCSPLKTLPEPRMYGNEGLRYGGASEIAMLARARRVSRLSGQRGTSSGSGSGREKEALGKCGARPALGGAERSVGDPLRDTPNTFSPASGGRDGGKRERRTFAFRFKAPPRSAPAALPAHGTARHGAGRCAGPSPAASRRLRTAEGEKGAEDWGGGGTCGEMRGGVTERRSAPIAIRRGVTWKQAPKNSRANDERRPGDRAERSGGGEEEQSSCQVIFSTAPTNFGLTLKRTHQMPREITTQNWKRSMDLHEGQSAAFLVCGGTGPALTVVTPT